MRRHVTAHVVVQATTGQNDFRMVADALRFMGEVIGVYTDTVTANQARTERQEVPFGTGCQQYGFGIDVHFVENHGQFVDQGDVQVALGVFNHFGGFGHFDAAGFVGADGDDFVVQFVHHFGDFRSRA